VRGAGPAHWREWTAPAEDLWRREGGNVGDVRRRGGSGGEVRERWRLPGAGGEGTGAVVDFKARVKAGMGGCCSGRIEGCWSGEDGRGATSGRRKRRQASSGCGDVDG
jgi:hypothetical protein